MPLPGAPVMPSTINPNLTSIFLPIRAFNLIPGATFMLADEPDPRVWVVEKVARDDNFEEVSFWVHDATNTDLPSEKAFLFDYNYQVALVGLIVNPQDPDDNDWGN